MSIRQTARIRRTDHASWRPSNRRSVPRRALGLALAVLILTVCLILVIGRLRPADHSGAGPATLGTFSGSQLAEPAGIRSAAQAFPWLAPQAHRDRIQAVAAGELPNWSSLPGGARPVQLQADLVSWTQGRPGTYGLVVLDLATGGRYSVNPGRAFPPASLYKLLVLAEVYRQIEVGRLALTDRLTIEPADATIGEPEGGVALGEEVTIERAIEAIAQVSSNNAAQALMRRLGPETIAGSPGRLGLTGTRFRGVDDDQAVTTADDLAGFFERLVQGEIVSHWVSQQILDQLARSRLKDRLPAELPAGTIVAHKTGDLEGVVHDAGIVYGPRGPIVVVFLSEDVGNGQASRDLRRLARVIYDALVG